MGREPGLPRRRRFARALLIGWLALLAASHLVSCWRPLPPPPEGVSAVLLPAIDRAGHAHGTFTVAYRAFGPPEAGAGGLPVILLHGSPGSGRDFGGLAPLLARHRRVIVPDLPGFGSSSREVPDCSWKAHARTVLELMDRLDIERAHVVGFSMGGGVALEMSGLAPRRVASMTLLASIGAVEFELFGQPELNHLVHGLQLGLFRAADWLLPHFGLLDRGPLDVAYARNFWESDQRRLRGLLVAWDGPLLIVHGAHDFLVPLAAARESARLAPQARLVVHENSGHFTVFTDPGRLVPELETFFDDVERKVAQRRADVPEPLLARARQAPDPASVPPLTGPGLALALLLLAAATLASEDLACIGAGLLVAAGRIPLAPAVGACLAGIFAGDMGLFFVGRVAGRAALAAWPLRGLVSRAALERACRWFERRGPLLVVASRFTPGARLPTYLAAGVLGTSIPRFAGWFLFAAALWTPLLVGGAALAGRPVLRLAGSTGAFGPLVLLLALALGLRLAVLAASHRGRRRLVGWWRRWSRWEFWPPWLFYPPIVLCVLWHGLRLRGLTLFTAVNPLMPAGGFVGERKHEILEAVRAADEGRVARWVLLRAGEPREQAKRRAAAAVEDWGGFPVVVKPDAGQRGRGVLLVRDTPELARTIGTARQDLLVQEYVAGPEYGIFWARHPGRRRGRIISLTEKRVPAVVGDGRRTLEELILDDPRAVALWRTYVELAGPRAADVPPAGQRVELAWLGTHCRGAIFADGGRLITAQLERAVDELSRRIEGFDFGRFDVRATSGQALSGRGEFVVIELNGVTSEATHVYDESVGVREAWRTLCRQWRLAFELGAERRALGHRPVPARRLAAVAWKYYRECRRAERTGAPGP